MILSVSITNLPGFIQTNIPEKANNRNCHLPFHAFGILHCAVVICTFYANLLSCTSSHNRIPRRRIASFAPSTETQSFGLYPSLKISSRVCQDSTAHLTLAGMWEISLKADASSRLSISSSEASFFIILKNRSLSSICLI